MFYRRAALRSTDRLHFLNFEAIPQKVGLEFAFKGGKKIEMFY